MINFIGQKRVAFKPLLEYDIESMNVSTNHIFNELMNMAKKYFLIRKKQSTTKTPWLTRNMIRCLRQKHLLFKSYKSGKINHSVYKRFSNILRMTISVSKTIYERNLLHDLSGDSRRI